MARDVLSLALRITGNASGLRLTPVERALKSLEEQTKSITGQFDKFGTGSAAAARAQEQFGNQLAGLEASLKAGEITAKEFAAQFDQIRQAATAETAALERAAQITDQNRTAAERFDIAQAELKAQLDAGRISTETYSRAVDKAAKGLTDAERAARGFDKAAEGAADNSLKFNELSGIFAVLPGPLGNIAGRISGISSASEGLSRIFAGGLRSGITNVASSFTALVNPVTASLAGLAAFGAGATAVARGLVSLEDRVERLGRLANQLGISFEFVQTLEEAGKRTDVSIEQLSGSFARLQNTLAGADEESKKAQAALQRLGVSVQEFGQLSEEQRIELIGERLAQIEDPAQRSAAAIALFGRSGVQLLPFFNELGLAAADMERFGRAVSDLDRARLADFGGSIDALSLAAQGLGQSLLLPFTGLGDGIARALAEVTAGITSIIDPIGRVLEPALTNIGRVVEALGVSLGTIGRVIGAVFEPFAVVVQEVSQAFSPLLDSLLDFQRTLSESVVSVTEWIVSFTPLGAVAANAQAFGETISRVVTIITTAFSRVGEFIGNLVTRFAEFFGLSDSITAIGNTISSIFGGVSEVFSTIANAIGGVVGRLLTIAENFLGIDRSAQAAAEATATLGTEIEALTEEERKLATEREKFLQGFTDNVSKAIDESAKFGQAGFDAAVQYQESIARLKEQLDAGLFNEETFRREAEKAGVAFRQELDTLEQNAQLDIQINADAEKTLAGLSAEIDKAIQRAEQFGQAGFDAALEFQNKLEALRKQFEAGIINEEVLKRGVAAANAEYDTQIDKIKQAQEEQKKLIEGDKSRIDGLLKTNDATTKIEEDLAAVTREIERVAEAQAAARDAGDQAAAGAAAARIAELDQLQAKLDDNLQAAEQGFGEAGFGPAFAQIDQQLGGLQEKALEFGAAGQAAFLRLQEGVAAAQEQARDGILNREALEQQVAAQQKAFEQELKNIDEAAKARAKAADDAVKAEERRQQEIARAQDEQQKAIEKSQEQAQQKYLEEQKKIFEERRKAEEAEFKRQEERLQKLNTLGQLSVNTSDVRTSEGAALVIDLAANAQDPRLIQERLQTKLLEKIALSLAGAAANYFNSPVAIVGAARLG